MKICSLPCKVHSGRALFLGIVVISILISEAAVSTLSAAVIKGNISDADDGNPVVGATVVLESLRRIAQSNLSGEYQLRNIPPGEYSLEVRGVGYMADTVTVSVKEKDEVVRLNIALKVDTALSTSVIVTARRLGESDAAARQTEQNSPTVVSVLSAESIARSPDVATAEAIKRMPGITITRVRGEAREAVIRGMAPSYNSTLVDGIRIPSPNTTSRVVQLDFLPADLVERVEVTKSLTPDMEGDAIGGAVNLVMRSAPENFLVRARLGTGYRSTFFDKDLTSFRTDSILEDPLERFGTGYQAKADDFPRDNLKLTPSTAPPDIVGDLTIGGRTLDNRLGFLLAGSAQQTYQLSEVVRNYDAVDINNGLYLIDRQYRLHSHSKTKYGFNAKLDYILGKQSEITASTAIFLRQNRESRILSDTNLVFNPVLYTGERTVFQRHTIISTNLGGEHHPGEFSLKWKTGIGFARQYKPDRAEFLTSAALAGDSVISEPIFYASIRDWQHNEDRDYYGGIDLSWEGLKKNGLIFSGGGLYRTKDKSNYQNAYRLLPIADSANNIPVFTSIDETRWKVFNTGGTPEYGDNNYTAQEDVSAAYLMASWTKGKFNVLAGARMEITAAEYATHDVNLLARVTAEKHYTDLLPSLHVRYALDPESNLRLSLGRSLSRPNFFDLVPYNYIGDDLREKGNPYLERTRSTNVDLKYETFPDVHKLFSVGAFYKHIEDPIEVALDLSNPAIPSMSPQNLGTATNIGAEVVAGTTFFDKLTLLINYTWTHSSITTDKIRFDKEHSTTVKVPETRGLQGQSEHSANIALSWNDQDLGTFAQINLSFTGSRIAEVSPYYGLDHIQNDFPILDFSAEQHLFDRFSLFLKLNNILDTEWEVHVRDGGTLIEREHFGSEGVLGVSYHF